jgi:flagellar biosynthetic protein FliP
VRWLKLALFVGLALFPLLTMAEPGLKAVTTTSNPDGSQTYSITIRILLLMTALTFLPSSTAVF